MGRDQRQDVGNGIRKESLKMNSVSILTMKDGEIVLNKKAKANASIEDICEIAECEVNGGYADYARVTVDGEIYMELEA